MQTEWQTLFVKAYLSENGIITVSGLLGACSSAASLEKSLMWGA